MKKIRGYFLVFAFLASFLFDFKIVQAVEETAIPISSVSTDSQSKLYPVANAIDNNPATFWHTNTSVSSPHPHYLILDLEKKYSVNSFHYLPRQDGSTGGVITEYKIYVSESTTNWGNAVSEGTFEPNNSEKKVSFDAKTGRYVKFVSLSDIKKNGSAGASEVKVFGTVADNYEAEVYQGPEISVGLWSYTKDSLEDEAFKIDASKDYVIKDMDGKKIATVSADETTKIKYNGDKNFLVYDSIEEIKVKKEVRFEAKDGDNSNIIFNVHRPSSSYDEYRGKIKIKYTDNNNIWVINTLPMEYYAWGMGETTGTGPFEHTKVMTTIFRTYGYWYKEYATKYLKYGFTIKSDSGSQIYRGYEWEVKYPNIKKAAEKTKGIIVRYGNEIALTPYSSWSDGKTRSFKERWGSNDYPWCKSVKDPYGKHPAMSTKQLEAAGNHMVGLIANGSVKLAGEKYKKNYDWIIKYYYTKISLKKMY